MDEQTFDKLAAKELRYLEDRLFDIDPDDIEVTSSDGVLTLELRDGVRVVVNSHRAARQIWMAAVATAWHFNYDSTDGKWRTAGAKTEELRAALHQVIQRQIGLDVAL